MEGVRRSGGVARGRERQLNRRVRRQWVDTARRHEVLRGARAAHDLEQDRDGGGHEARVVNEEVRAVLVIGERISVEPTAELRDERSRS